MEGLDPGHGTELMDQLAALARRLAVEALNQLIAQEGDPTIIAEAQQFIDEGDAFRAAVAFKDAVDKYKDALVSAESA